MGAGIGLALLLFALSQTKSDKPKGQTFVGPSKPTGKATDFINTMLPHAVVASKKFPQVPPQLILAFAGLESGWGKSAPKHNYFGLKPGKGYTGQTQLFDTTEVLPKATGYKFPKVYSVTPHKTKPGKYVWKVQDRFRAFNNPSEAFTDYAKFVTTGRYKNAYNSKNIKDIVTNLWKAGYATDPDYVGKIMKLVDLINKVISQR